MDVVKIHKKYRCRSGKQTLRKLVDTSDLVLNKTLTSLCSEGERVITSRIFPQKSTSSAGNASHFSFNAGHFDSKTKSAIEPSLMVY